MPIGRFARLTGLSVKALRRYDELGLLRPASVDPATGYRWYSPEQVHAALHVRKLRALDLPLTEIRRLLEGGDERAVLAAHRARIEARLAHDAAIVEELGRLISGEEKTVPEDVLYRIEIKEMPEQDLVLIGKRVPAAKLTCWFRAAFRELFDSAGGQRAGPPFAIAPAPDEAEMVAAQAALPILGEVEPRGRVRLGHEGSFRALVALHRGPVEKLPEIHRALWNAIKDRGISSAGEPREIYLGDPAEAEGTSDSLTEVAWPVDLSADWRPDDRRFTKQLSTER